MSALEGDRDAVMKTLGDTIRALDAPDQWRILAVTLNALEKAHEHPTSYRGQIEGYSATITFVEPFWRANFHA